LWICKKEKKEKKEKKKGKKKKKKIEKNRSRHKIQSCAKSQ